MGSTEEGSICQLGQARGMNKALDKMIQDVIAKTKTVRTGCLQFHTVIVRREQKQ